MGQPAATQQAQGLERDPAGNRTIVPRAFVSEQSAGSLLRNTMALYRMNFRPVFLTYVLPAYPVLVLQELLTPQHAQDIYLFIAVSILGWIVSVFALGAVTVTISDISLGNAPSVRRSYDRLLKGGGWVRLLANGILQGLWIVVGLILLIVPGLILMIRLMMSSAVVVLEGETATNALKRSMFLTKGHLWRLSWILGVLGLVLLVVYSLAALVIFIPFSVFESGLESGLVEIVATVLLTALIAGVLYPILFIAIVLMYYDLRARKEAYDVETLSEDLMR